MLAEHCVIHDGLSRIDSSFVSCDRNVFQESGMHVGKTGLRNKLLSAPWCTNYEMVPLFLNHLKHVGISLLSF